MSWKDNYKRRSKELTSGGRFKVVDGENDMRIMPNKLCWDAKRKVWDTTKFPPSEEVRMHYSVGPDKRAQICGKKLNYDSLVWEGKCWLCDQKIPELSRHPSKAQMVEDMSATDQLLLQVAPISNGAMLAPKPFWISSRRLHRELLNALWSSKRSYDSPTKGHNITITVTGTGMQKEFKLDWEDEPSKVAPNILAGIKPFSEIIGKYNEAAQRAAFAGESVEAEEEDADGEYDDPDTNADTDSEGYDDDDVPNDEDVTVDEEALDDEEPSEHDEPADDADEDVADEDDSEPPEADEDYDPEPEPVRRKTRPAPAATRKPVKRPPPTQTTRRPPPPAKKTKPRR